MRILVVSTDFIPNVSGIATLSFEQAAGLQCRGHTVKILTTTAGAAHAAANAKFHVQDATNKQPPILRLVSLFQILYGVVADWKPDFIWCTNYRGFGLPVMTIAQRNQIPYGIYYHGTELVTESKRVVRRLIFKAVATHAALRCTNSINTARILTQRYGIDAVPVTPGVHAAADGTSDSETLASSLRESWFDQRPIKCTKEQRLVFLAACRVSREKGIHIILEALALLKDELLARTLFVAVGSGNAISDFKNQAARLGVSGHVLFLGPVTREELPLYLSAADIYLQPSQPEGDFLESFGISFLEAQASGLPCIGTNWGGVPEAVQCPRTAILVAPRSAEAVAEAMATAILDEPWRATAGAAGPVWAAQNSWNSHVKKIESLISHLIPD